MKLPNQSHTNRRLTKQWDQCEPIGRILQVLGNTLSHQNSPNILLPFGLLLITLLLCKKCVATIWAIFYSMILFHHLVTLSETYFYGECSLTAASVRKRNNFNQIKGSRMGLITSWTKSALRPSWFSTVGIYMKWQVRQASWHS